MDTQLPTKREENELSFRLVADDYDPELTEGDTVFIGDYFGHMRHSPVHTAALICKGRQCEIAKHCPLYQLKKKLPEGRPCPVERELVRIWTIDLMQELRVEEDAHVDRSQIAQLVHSRLTMKRTQEVLADTPSLMESFKGMTEDGVPIMEPKLNPLLAVFDKHFKISDQILNSLIATREAKAKDKSRESMTMAQLTANVVARAREIKASDPKYIEVVSGEARVPDDEPIDAEFRLTADIPDDTLENQTEGI